jgi:uncharacterized protein YuzE
MKIEYDKEIDILYIKLIDLPIDESDMKKEGVALDYPVDGQLVGIEVLDTSKSSSKPNIVE